MVQPVSIRLSERQMWLLELLGELMVGKDKSVSARVRLIFQVAEEGLRDSGFIGPDEQFIQPSVREILSAPKYPPRVQRVPFRPGVNSLSDAAGVEAGL